MSLNNVIPASLLLGEVTITHKPVENPEVSIPDDLVTSCTIKYAIDDYGIQSHADHPAFAELRKVLSARGYIEIPPYACWNGDRVLKRFRFNGFQLEPGDKFYSAGAWRVRISIRNKRNENDND